jgi:hypothetical protein
VIHPFCLLHLVVDGTIDAMDIFFSYDCYMQHRDIGGFLGNFYVFDTSFCLLDFGSCYVMILVCRCRCRYSRKTMPL